MAERFEVALADDVEDPETAGQSLGDRMRIEAPRTGGKNERWASKAASDARARYNRTDRIETIIGLMVRNEWTAAKRLQMASEWGVTYDCVKEYASVASTIVVTLTQDSKDELKAAIVNGVEALRLRCEADPDPKAQAVALKAYELLTRIHGLEAPRQTELTVKAPTREEALAELREAAKSDPSVLEAVGIPLADLTQGDDDIGTGKNDAG